MFVRDEVNNNKSKLILNLDLIYVFLFIFFISISGYYYIKMSHDFNVLKKNKIPLLKSKIENFNNSLAVEKKRNNYLIRHTLKSKAKELGMIKASYPINIIDNW